uniref:Uncharacterized protein n=1 Tax=uncultured bacterium contig00178 TaxID=1181600 RepID=A0A806KHY4_9BACT|nr:hypothetical protein [uncultured bacterium contig00178]
MCGCYFCKFAKIWAKIEKKCLKLGNVEKKIQGTLNFFRKKVGNPRILENLRFFASNLRNLGGEAQKSPKIGQS